MGMIWVQKADFGGGGAYLMASFVIGTKAYVGTAHSSTAPYYHKFFYEYNPTNNTWTKKLDLAGEARDHAIGFSIDGYGYICCGSSHIGGSHVLKDHWRYDPSGNSWTQMTDFGGIGRSGPYGFSIGNYGYVGGGAGWGTGTLTDFWRYDPSGDSWAQMADLPGDSRMYGESFVIGSYGYVCTGWHQPNGGGYRLKELWQYDPSGDSWTQKTDFPGTARHGVATWSDGTFGYVLLGSQSGAPWQPNDGYYYDPTSNSWTAIDCYFSGTNRWQSEGFYVDGHGYVVAGQDVDGNKLDDTWRYEPEAVAKGSSSALQIFAKMLSG